MADYYPLISRAVAGLAKNTGENRRAVYDRARTALLTQLRGITPALAESDITRERLALEESVRKVEAEAARQYAESQRQSRARPGEPRKDGFAAPRPAVAPPPPLRSSAPPPSRNWAQGPDPARSPPPPPAEMRPSDLFARRAAEMEPEAEPPPPPRWAAPEPRAPEARAPEAPPPSESRFSFFRRGRSETAEPEPAPAAPAKAPPAAEDDWVYPSGSRYDADLRMLNRHAPPERMFEDEEPRAAASARDPRADFGQPMLEPDYGEEQPDPARAADQAAEEEQEYEDVEAKPRRSYRGLIRGLAAAVVIVAVGGALFWQWPTLVALYRSYRSPPVETVKETAPAPNARTKIADRIEPGQQAPAALTTPATAAAQKVVLYEEDPGDPNGKRFVGSAVWRTETVTPGPGQPPELAIRADVEVPERKLAMTWSLRRNTDKGLPATHTVEIMFKLPTDFAEGGISNVPGILMKQAEQTRGTPLAGLAVKVTSGFYLIGLSNVDTDKERNLQLLKERAWFDIPVVYNNNRRAILAMEKGLPGERAFADAFKAWKQ